MQGRADDSHHDRKNGDVPGVEGKDEDDADEVPDDAWIRVKASAPIRGEPRAGKRGKLTIDLGLENTGAPQKQTQSRASATR
jgi:hypothetical protein